MADRFYRDIELPNFDNAKVVAAPDTGFIQIYGREGYLAVNTDADLEQIITENNGVFGNDVSITINTTANSTTTGALTVTGGISTQENFWAGGTGNFVGKVSITNTTQSNETITDAALLVAGGVGIEKDLHIKGDLHIVGTGTLRFGPYDVGTTTGNLWWVRPGGLNENPTVVNGAGEQLWTAFGSIKHALKYADFGDTVLVQPGEYTEAFPMYVPAGVSIRGAGLRETQIKPTVGTNNKDAFLLSGDSTISDFTVKDFFYDSGNDTGYAFRFATYTATLSTGTAVVTVTDTTGLVVGQVLTKISGIGEFGVSAVISTIDSATQFTANISHFVAGTIVFSTAKTTNRSTYIERCTVLCKGSVTSSTDPYGFAQGDAGRGALIDGSILNRTSIENAMLFNEMTFIVPNSRGVILTNGARCEMLTSFIYFADLAVEGVVGTAGKGMDGKTYITLSGAVGSWNNGDTIRLYDTDGSTVLASEEIEDILGNLITIDGSAAGFEVNANRSSKTVEFFGNAQLDTAIQKIGSASLLLDGTGDYLKVEGGSDFQFAGDFCAEGWFYPNSVTGSQYLFSFGTESSGRYVLFLDGTTIKGNYFGGSTTTYGGTLTTGTWYHVALSRAGSTMTVYLDGTALGTTETNANTLGNTGVFKLGADASSANTFSGHFDEVRITKGFRRYSGTFTPYTTARTGDADTVLLLHFDGTDGATSTIDDGVNFQDVRSSGGGTATAIVRYDRSEFAAELRSIACAFVYGNEGIKADGVDVSLQLMAHNFAYIGTGADLTNDKSAVVQANEVIEVNGGRVFYNSVDQTGNFRVGESFLVDFQTGAVSFSGGTFDVTALGSINFVDGANTTAIDAFGVSTGNISVSGNSITTTTGNLTLDPSGVGTIALNGGTTVTGTFSATGATTLTAGTASSSTSTGTLVVTGGAGVSGTVYAGGFTGPLTGTASLATSIAGGAANRIAYQSAADTTAFAVAPTVGGTYLRWNGSAFDWITATFSAAGSANQIQYNSGGNLAASANLTYDSTANRLALTGTDAEILLTGITNEPAAPAAGEMLFYSKSMAGRMLPKIVGPSSFDTSLQTSLATNRISWWNATGNGNAATNITLFNFVAPTIQGTATTRNVASTNVFTRTRRIGYVSPATQTATSNASQYSTVAQYTIGSGTAGIGGFYYVFRFGFADTITTSIKFIGMTSAIGAPSNTASPTTFTNAIGVGAAAGDTNLSIYYGGSAVQTPIALGANFPARTANTDLYELILFAPSNLNNTVGYRVTRVNTGDVAQGTLTAAIPGTQLPLSTTFLAHRAFVANNNVANAVTIDIASLYIETDS